MKFKDLRSDTVDVDEYCVIKALEESFNSYFVKIGMSPADRSHVSCYPKLWDNSSQQGHEAGEVNNLGMTEFCGKGDFGEEGALGKQSMGY